MSDRTTVRIGADDIEVSEQTAAWLAAQPVSGGPAAVLARYSARSQDEWRAERAEKARVDAARERAHDVADAALLGRGAPLHTVGEALTTYLAMSEIDDAREDARRSVELEQRAVQREARIAQLESELAAERQAHSRTSQRAREAVDGWGRARQRAEQGGGYSQRRDYVRTGGPIISIR